MIIDTNIDVTPHLAALKAAGVKTVIRYLSPINPGGEKCIKPAEAHAIAAAGLRLALVCEGWGDFAHGAISAGAGERDGQWCAKYAPNVGAPEGAAIFYAVDVDATGEQIKKLVVPYFAAITAQHLAAATKYRCGVYGSGNVLSAVMNAGVADLPWLSCSLGWGGSRAYLAIKKWVLRQHTPAHIAGIDCDANDANVSFGEFADFGDFVPFSQPALAAAPPIPLARADEDGAAPHGESLIERAEDAIKKVI